MVSRSFLSRVVSRVNRSPEQVRSRALTLLFGRAVRFAGIAGVRVESLTESCAVLSMRNRKRVQNHLGSIHGAAMGLLVESASGLVVGMNVPDSRVVGIKTLHLDYVKRASGDVRAIASLNSEQMAILRNTERGELAVQVEVLDEKGLAPVRCQVIWAWNPKVRHRRADLRRKANTIPSV